uniref:Tetratricopeptide repeat domain 12 n=1 Tax=Lepisosteus oculatus TaxID=7918 RepID=W5M9Y4_LEPOC|nr:PREDICTED: tetratricopeptide repeat protein 12 [Lepisosteus oculatus]
MLKEDEDLDRFLKRVDEISGLVKELNSSDPVSQEKAVVKADELISAFEEQGGAEEPCKTRINRTVINTRPPPRLTSPQGLPNDSQISQEHFLKILEKDAEDRRKRRKENETLANALKEMGNEAFAQGNYETAVQCYSEGLEKLRDMHVLYTNRAQAYIKLKKYKEAISDCDWALRCSANCIKAYVHMGKANLALNNYEEARKSYKKILDIEPKRANLVKEYLNEVDLEEKKESQEKEAQEQFEQGKENAMSVLELLQKLEKPDQISLYYAGGIRLLSETIRHCTEQTLFRINNGFSIINGNNIVRRSLAMQSAEPHCDELCTSVLELWKAVCKGNEENQQLLIHYSGKHLVSLLPSRTCRIQTECMNLLGLYTQTQYGRRLVLQNLDLYELVENLLGFIRDKDTTAICAMTILGHLAAENKFRVLFRENFTTMFVPPFADLLQNISSVDETMLPLCISMMNSMTEDNVIRGKIASCQEFWDVCLITMDDCALCSPDKSSKHCDLLFALLGFMMNLSMEITLAVEEKAVHITARCLTQLCGSDGGIITRTMGLLSHILPHSPAAAEEAVQKGIVKKIFRLVKAGGKITTHFSVRTLSACTKVSQQAREEIVRVDKKFSSLMKLLSMDEELVVGNAALCLGHCLEVPGAASSLLGSNIVKILLKHAGGDASKTAVQQNCAVALGKLCTAEPRHMVQLRELHGLEILNSCMKFVT